MIGEKYGRLVIIKLINRIKGSLRVRCLCDCGNCTEVYYSNLKKGKTKSCGCLRKEIYEKNKRIFKGSVFGKLEVVGVVGQNRSGKLLWKCKCVCGNKSVVCATHLLSGHTKSCGCLLDFDIIGQKFGRLTVLERVGKNKSGNILWKCKCSCGNEVSVAANHLRSGHTQSCGCLWFERIWKGGISFEPYCFDWTKDLKKFIKQRDDYKCINPDCWGTDDVLSIHHINYNKKSCGPDNLITLCRSCNSRANSDREWHMLWYQAIMYMRYGYKYMKVETVER